MKIMKINRAQIESENKEIMQRTSVPKHLNL